MDKRILLRKKTYQKSDGTSFEVPIYVKKNNRGISARLVYGELELYVSSYVTMKQIDDFVLKLVKEHPDHILNRPFMKEGIYCYVLGQKKMFTNDASLKNESTFFYVPKITKDPLNAYKKQALFYFKERVAYLAKKMHIDISSFVIRTGLFLSYYGVCFPTKKMMKFDYRLFAYKTEISDSILIHELAHTFEVHHNERFYAIVKMYCPDYDILEDDIRCGRFEGRLDRYVL